MKITTIPRHTPIYKGTIARVAIQCECPDTGLTGSFLFTGESHKTKGSRVSPIYDDLAELFPAVKAHWQEVVEGNCGPGFTARETINPNDHNRRAFAKSLQRTFN